MSSEPGHATGSGNDVTTPAHPKPETADIPTSGIPSGEIVPADAAPTTATTPEEHAARLSSTRTAWTWATVVVAILVLVVLLIFILQNLESATVNFLGLRGTLPLGIAMLLSAAVGGLLVALIGSARILQLRRTARRRKH